MNGWVSIERDLWDHPLFGSEPMSEREAWIWMVARAAWADTGHRVGSEVVDVPRGSLVITLRGLQSAFMWRSDTKVRNFLSRLEGEGMIERTTVGKRNAPKTHVTICNYDAYQSSERTKNAPKTHRERTKNAVKEQVNNITTEEPNGSLAKKRASRLPDDWVLPRCWGEWAVSEGWPEEVVRVEAAKFRDYWIGVGGQKGAKRDWQATWRNWMRNSRSPKVVQGGHNGNGNHNTDRLQRIVSAAAGGTSRQDWG